MSDHKQIATLRPWRVLDDGTLGSIVDARGEPVGHTFQRLNDPHHMQRKANAELIVSAVNSYSAMREALNHIADKGCSIIHSNYPEGTTCRDIQSYARINETPYKFAKDYRARILAGKELCDRCRAALALADESEKV